MKSNLLQKLIVDLLNRPTLFGRLTLISVFIPYLFVRIPLLQKPMLFAGIVLFLTLNQQTISYYFDKFVNAHIWIKLQYFWYTVGLVVLSSILYSIISQLFSLEIIITLFYFLILFIWYNKIIDLITEQGDDLIFKGQTTTKTRNINFAGYLQPLLISLLGVSFIIIFQSIIITKGRSVFSVQTIYWTFPLVVILSYFIIDALVREQIYWLPEDGITEFKSINVDGLELPQVNQPFELAQYFEKVKKIENPPQNVLNYLEDNLEYLVDHAQDLRYLPFQIQLIKAMGCWGEKIREYLHIILVIILISISKYRLTGFIPLYKRKLFYSCLQVIAMSGSLTPKWREIIQYEVIENKDKFHVLDWTVGAKYNSKYYPHGWLRIWEGIIYKGKEGYYEAVNRISNIRQTMPMLNNWQKEIWDTSIKYAEVFVGSQGRKLMAKKLSLHDQLLYLSQGYSIEEYIQKRRTYQQELQNPRNRLSHRVQKTKNPRIDKKEAKQRIMSFIKDEEETESNISFLNSVKYIISDYFQKFKKINFKTVFVITAYICILLLNIFSINWVYTNFSPEFATLGLFIEILILVIISISPSNADIKLSDSEADIGGKIKTRTRQFDPLQISREIPNKKIWPLVHVLLVIAFSQPFY